MKIYFGVKKTRTVISQPHKLWRGIPYFAPLFFHSKLEIVITMS